MRKFHFTEAITKLEELRNESQFGQNELLNVMIGQCYHYNGEHDTALKYLQEAHSNNFHISEGLSTLSAIYLAKKQGDELDKLTRLYMSTNEYTGEHWVLFAHHFLLLDKRDKALYFAHKACYDNPRNVEACLVKGMQTDEKLILFHIRLIAIMSNFFNLLCHFISQNIQRKKKIQRCCCSTETFVAIW